MNINLPTTPSVFILLIGTVFLLIAIVGKIITPKLKTLQVPPWGRILPGVIGGILVFIGINTIIDINNKSTSIVIDEPMGEIYSTEEHVSIIVKGRIENFPN